AVAQTSGRPVVDSRAATHAASPQPPKRKLALVLMPGTSGSVQRCGLCVGRRPRKSRTSTVLPDDQTDDATRHIDDLPHRLAFEMRLRTFVGECQRTRGRLVG